MGPVLHRIAGIPFSPRRRLMPGVERKVSICRRISTIPREIHLELGKAALSILHLTVLILY
jgi:hypothetical protein